MLTAYDAVYLAGLVATLPVWMLCPKWRVKVLGALCERWTVRRAAEPSAGRCVLVHAVSVGEVNATAALVRGLLDRDLTLSVVVTSTTATGFERAQQLFAGLVRVSVLRFPLDLSVSVVSLLDAVRPDVVALMELEVWPVMLHWCARRRIPVVVLNGRISDASDRAYRVGRHVLASTFSRIAHVAAQDEVYAGRFVRLGVPRRRISVTGSMKFDSAPRSLGPAAADTALLGELGFTGAAPPMWVCGSTGPGEEEAALAAFRLLRHRHTNLRLVLAPRKPERAGEIVRAIEREQWRLARRSLRQPAADAEVILVDTLGELRRFYTLATVVFVGRTLIDLGAKQHGSDMIEPAALGRAVVVGPFTANFAEPMRAFRRAGAVVEIKGEPALLETVGRLLSDSSERSRLTSAAMQVVEEQRGATGRCVERLLAMLSAPAGVMAGA